MQCISIVAAGQSYVETSFPIGRNGEGRAIMGTAMNWQTSLKITKY
jgi:hypothetical protein